MALRVTPGMMHSQLMRNINHNMVRMDHQQNTLSTGRKLNKPSDDPAGITYSLRYRSELSMNEQFDKNIAQAKSQLNFTDSIIGQVNDMVQKVQELTVQGLNDTNPQSALNAIAIEVGQIYEQAVMAGNETLNGKFIFNGQFTDIKPYDTLNAQTQDTDTQKFSVIFSAGINIPVNVTGNEVFGASGDSDNLFKVLKDIENALTSNDKPGLANASALLQSRFEKVINIRSEVGARTNRVELIGTRLEDLNVNLTGLQSQTEDADMAETIMNFNQEQSVYQASLSTGAKIIQPSLIDYLR
ncbi:flagellar hook-associated protein FlgL [Paenibacillus sp. GCM10023252]|uniref:flagellar hook-associated protein FlgL n=1 Tax=Paenibacillus sp. GCM10023252 TaxID=3252649 RepID=UPI003612EF63